MRPANDASAARRVRIPPSLTVAVNPAVVDVFRAHPVDVTAFDGKPGRCLGHDGRHRSYVRWQMQVPLDRDDHICEIRSRDRIEDVAAMVRHNVK